MSKNILTVALLLALACGPAQPPDDKSPIESTVDAADGLPIVYDVRGAGETTLLFVHCWACDREFWREQVEQFASEYRVVTLDLPGHGASGTDREEWSLAGLAADVETVADQLDLERIILVGHSMGGPVSLLAASRLQGRAIGVVCADTLHNADFEWPEGMTEMFASRLQTDPEGFMREFVPAMFRESADPGVVQWVIERALAADTTATVELMRDFENLDLARALSAAGVPIRCINATPQGEQGMTTEIEINRKYADFDAVLMDDVGHYVQLERPQEFNRLLAETLESLSP